MTILLIIRLKITLSITKPVEVVKILVLDVIKELSISIKDYVKVISSKLVITIISRIILIKSISRVNLIDKESFF